MELPENHPFAVKKRVSGVLTSAMWSSCHPSLKLPWLLGQHWGAQCSACPVVHPQVTKDEEKLQEERLKVTRGLPLQDLAGAPSLPFVRGSNVQYTARHWCHQVVGLGRCVSLCDALSNPKELHTKSLCIVRLTLANGMCRQQGISRRGTRCTTSARCTAVAAAGATEERAFACRRCIERDLIKATPGVCVDVLNPCHG